MRSGRQPRPTLNPEALDHARTDTSRRLTGDERKTQILREAALFFAERGFQGSTRALADRLGITQAALYKHFESKNALITALFEAAAERWRKENWDAALADDGEPLPARLGRAYADYLSRMSGPGLRLFIRAGLDGLAQPARRGAMLTATILEPVIAALRADIGLETIAHGPLLHGEREVAMALHGSLMFLAIRKHVYRMPMPDDLRDLIDLQVRLWLPGARAEVERLHANTGEPRQLAPRPKPQRLA
jgi:AcrR family transcriptional regulator